MTSYPLYPSILASIPSTFLAIYPGPKTGISRGPGSSPHPLPKDCIKAYSPRVPATFSPGLLSRQRACSCSRTEMRPENFFYNATSVYTDFPQTPLQKVRFKNPLYVASRRNFSKIFSTTFWDVVDDEDDDPQSPSIWPLCWIARKFFQKIF